jgi:4-aminobutyrate aminotransferase-like enzyme
MFEGAMFGPEGRERELERLTREHLRILAERHPGVVSEVDGVGAMMSFRVGDGALETTRAFIRRCFDAGLVVYYGGHEPACVRLFVPAAVITNDELTDAFTILDRCMD